MLRGGECQCRHLISCNVNVGRRHDGRVNLGFTRATRPGAAAAAGSAAVVRPAGRYYSHTSGAACDTRRAEGRRVSQSHQGGAWLGEALCSRHTALPLAAVVYAAVRHRGCRRRQRDGVRKSVPGGVALGECHARRPRGARRPRSNMCTRVNATFYVRLRTKERLHVAGHCTAPWIRHRAVRPLAPLVVLALEAGQAAGHRDVLWLISMVLDAVQTWSARARKGFVLLAFFLK